MSCKLDLPKRHLIIHDPVILFEASHWTQSMRRPRATTVETLWHVTPVATSAGTAGGTSQTREVRYTGAQHDIS